MKQTGMECMSRMNKGLFLGLFPFLLLAGMACQTGQNGESREGQASKQDSAQQEQRTNDTLEAGLKEVEQALADDPENQALLFKKARLQFHKKNYKIARRVMDDLVSRDSTNKHYRYWFGKVHWKLNYPKGAIREMKKALAYDPEFKKAHLDLGKIYFYGKEREKSFDHLNEALRQDKYLAEAYLWKGLNYKEMDKPEEAISNLQTAVEIDPDNFRAQFYLGALHEADQPEKALAYYQNAARIKPGNLKAQYGVGITRQKIGKTEKAIETYHDILKQNPEHQQAHYNLGYLYYTNDSLEKAVKHFSEVLKFDEDHTKAYLGRGLAYQSLDEKQKARKDMQKVLAQEPNNDVAKETLQEISSQ